MPETDSRRAAARSLARGGLANLVGAGVTGLSTLLLTVVVARATSRADAGVFFSGTSIFLVVSSLGQLGTATGVVYFVVRARTTGQGDSTATVVRTALRPVLVVGVLAAIGVATAAPYLASLAAHAHRSDLRTYLWVLAAAIPLAGIETVWLAATRGTGAMRPTVMIEMIGRPLAQLVAVAVVAPTGSVVGTALAWATPYAGAALLSHRAWRRLAPTAPASRHLEGFWRFTAPRALTSVLQMLIQRLDIVLVGAIAGVAAAAVYTAATRLVVAGQFAVTAFTQATQPRLGAAITAGDRAGSREVYRLSTAWLVLLAWPLYLTLWVFGPTVLGIFGASYHAGFAVLSWLCVAMLLSTACGLADVVLSMGGRTSWNLTNAAVALAVNVGLDLWLIPGHGLEGAAIGWALAIVVRNLLAVGQVLASQRIHPMGAGVLAALSLSALAYGAIPLAVRVWWGAGVLPMVLAIAVGTTVWAALAWLGRRTLRLDVVLPRRRRDHNTGEAEDERSSDDLGRLDGGVTGRSRGGAVARPGRSASGEPTVSAAAGPPA